MRPRFDDDDWEPDDLPGAARSVHGEWFDDFFASGLITDVLMPLKSGKEASVYLCRAVRSNTSADLLAAKVFHDRERRGFRNNHAYRQGQIIGKHREQRAVRTKTEFGREVEEGWWRHREFEMLQTLHLAGADVPRPVAGSSHGLLMEFIGEEGEPAPQLKDTRLSPAEARRVFDRLIWNVELFLANHLVHADLSPYNVLYRAAGVTIIDLPQAVDARSNANARALLERDVENLCRHFDRLGIRTNAAAVAGELWRRFLYARI